MLQLQGTGALCHKHPEKKKNIGDSNKNKDISQLLCYNCKKLGHCATDCPDKKKNVGISNGVKPNLSSLGNDRCYGVA